MTTQWFDRAKKVIPGGVNSPVRAFGSVGGNPIFVVSGSGSTIKTSEGRKLIDFCGSWGPLILGHAHPRVVNAICKAAGKGTSFGISTPVEVEFAELLCELIPSMEKVRLVSSGTEAVMTALRLARGYTGRDKIIKFNGGYHGHSDSLLVSAGSGLLTAGQASSAGVPQALAKNTIVAPYNDVAAFEKIMNAIGDEIAAVVVEPVAGNMGLVPGSLPFLKALRKHTKAKGALLIFDEVISGFRLGPTTYGEQVGIKPDLTCLGKIIGGGLPIGALGGRRAVMDCLAPLGKVYQAGTLSGNPVAVAAGMETVRILKQTKPYKALAAKGAYVAAELTAQAEKAGVDFTCAQMGSMLTPFFCKGHINNMADAKKCDTKRYADFFQSLLASGIYFPPSQFEVFFISTAHSDADLDRLLSSSARAFAAIC
jgi:glutamate-1-semialdehyde 2,1-aminomutase